MSRAHYLDQIAIAALICFSTYLLIGDFGVRLANTTADDGLVRYAWFFRYPELFAHDTQTLTWAPVALVSLLNRLPAVLFKYFDVPPELFHWLFTFLQNVLLALAVYRYAVVATGSREAAWLSALIALACRPHWWNLGLFADADANPYAAWTALPLFVYAAAFALERRALAAALVLLAGGLVHPALGLFAAMMLGAYAALAWTGDRDTRGLAIRIACLGAVTLAFMLPAVVVQSGMEKEPLEQALPLVLGNAHVAPWDDAGCGFCVSFFLRALAWTVAVSVLALLAASEEGNHPHLRRFLTACAATALALCLLHVLFYVSRSIPGMRIIGLRSTILLVILALPVAVALLWRRFLAGPAPVALVAGYTLLLPSAASMLAATLALGSGGPRPRDRASDSGMFARVCASLGAALFVLLLARHVPKLGPRVDLYLLAPLFGQDSIPFAFGYQVIQFPWLSTAIAGWLCAYAAWRWLARQRLSPAAVPGTAAPGPRRAHVLALIAPLAVYLLMWNAESGRLATAGEARSYYEVQAWARAATPVTAEFIVGSISVYNGWRNYTHRPMVTTTSVCSVYLCTLSAAEHDRRIGRFYSRVGKTGYQDLDAASLRAFSREFGGDYAVRRRSWQPLPLPVAYENPDYVVYRVR